MRSPRTFTLLALAVCLFAGCSRGHIGLLTTQSGNASVSLAITDAPPAGVSPLSFEMVVSSAVLNPGNVQMISSPISVEMTRLALETSLLSAVSVTPGTYDSITFTFSSPSLTFRNDTSGTLTVGGTPCAAGQVCIAPPSTVNLVATASLPSSVMLTAGSFNEFLLDLNLQSLLTTPSGSPNTITVDLGQSGAVGLSELGDGASGSPAFEDVVGVVAAKDTANNRFTLQTGLASFTVNVDSGTAFSNFPSSACASASFACVANTQIASVDMSLRSDGAFHATRILFEDADNSQAEMEGIVIATTGLTPPAQLRMVVTQETPAVSGVPIGSVVTVAAGGATFDIDPLGPDTSPFSFRGVQDLLVGQQVQVRRLSTSTTTNIDAGRVRLRSSRISANVQSVAAPNFAASNLPMFLQTAGTSQITVETSGVTEFGGNALNFTQLAVNDSVSFRGQLFSNGGAAVLLATKVIKH